MPYSSDKIPVGKYMRALRKRRTWLNNRVRSARAEGKELTYDVEERNALDWALPLLEERLKDEQAKNAESPQLRRDQDADG